MAFRIRRGAPLGLALLSGQAVAGAGCLDALFADGFEASAMARYNVVLVVSQLAQRSAAFQLDGGETVTATGDGSYCFAQTVPGGQPYSVAIIEQPANGGACGGDALSGIADGLVTIEIRCDFPQTRWDEFEWDGADWN